MAMIEEQYKELKDRLEKDFDLKDKINKEVGAFRDENMNVQKIVDEQVAKILKERKVSPAYTEKPGSTFLKAWKTGEFIKKAWDMSEHGHKRVDADVVLKALGESSGAAGAFLLYDEFFPEIQKLIIEDQVVRKYARRIPMSMETIKVPRIVDTTHYGAAGAVTVHGGMGATVSAEAADRAATGGDPVFGSVQLNAHVYDNLVKVSNELLMDSPISVPPLLEELLFQGVGFKEDYDFLNGNGANAALGCISTLNPALISTTRTQTSHLNFDDAVTMWSRLFPSSQKRAIWVYSPAAFVDIIKFAVVVGYAGSSVMLGNVPGLTGLDAPAAILFGRPMICSEKVPTLAAQGDLNLLDLNYYLLGDRQQLTLTTSDQRYFETYQTAFLATERLDGQPWLASALTPANNGATLSAFINVAA